MMTASDAMTSLTYKGGEGDDEKGRASSDKNATEVVTEIDTGAKMGIVEKQPRL